MPDGRDLADHLARPSLFADLSRPELEGLAHAVDEEVFAEGQRILRKGLSGSGFFVILEGQAAIEVDGEQPWTLGPGDFFGELTLLAPGGTRIARVRASSPVTCLAIGRDDALRLVESEPSVALAMLKEIARRFASALPDS